LDRLIRAFVRTPFWIVIYLIQPLIWLLLFTQIFKSITVLPGFSTSSYVQFFAPGLIVTLAVFNSNFSGFQILSDINFGVLEKMLVTPVNRYGLIVGSLLYVAVTGIAQIVIVLGVSFLLGASVVTGVGGVLLTFVIVSLLAMGITGLLTALALRVKKPEPLVFVSSLITLPLIFLSSALIPASLTPDWVQTVMRFNPVNYAILAVRPLFLTGYDWTAIAQALIVCGALALVAIAVATVAVRRFGD
jgi:ABC-2 type transport system permease protein